MNNSQQEYSFNNTGTDIELNQKLSLDNELPGFALSQNDMEQFKVKEKYYQMKFRKIEDTQNAIISTTTEWFSDIQEKINNLGKQEIEKQKLLIRENISRLTEIGQLEDNWDNYNAQKFNPNLIFRCIDIVTSLELEFQPEIFPTAKGSIQFEYELDDYHYLEFEIYLEKIDLYTRIQERKIIKNNISLEEFFDTVNDFQSQI